jgi:predicted KAP-like P-loop ATPase
MWRVKRHCRRLYRRFAALLSFRLRVTFHSRFEFRKNIDIIIFRFGDGPSHRTNVKKIVLTIKIIKAKKKRRRKKIRVCSSRYSDKLNIWVAIAIRSCTL